VTEQVLSPRQLNRALLARQLLLERTSLSIGAAIDQVGGLQTQYAPSGYVGLWSRLSGFRRKDISLWAGVPAVALKEAVPGLELVGYGDASGREVVDLAGLALPHPETPAPVRFLPHWDAALLVHARRTGILPEHHRRRVFHTRNPFSVGTVLVNGSVAAAWTFRDGRIVVDPYEPIAPGAAQEIEMERSALEAFHQ
jgi:hypothetical protein